MRLEFHGAIRTVTGSCYLLGVGRKKILVDCGMYQGDGEIEERNARPLMFSPREIDAVLVTHAHIDHIGLLPRLVHEGFGGKIFCTRATRSLLPLMLKDSAHIQLQEAEWRNRKARRAGRHLVQPLYLIEDAEAACALARGVSYHEEFAVCENVRAIFRDAGHILGSAFIEVFATENGVTKKIVFSGDLGNREQAIIRDPEYADSADVLLVESTYGERNHKPREDTLTEFRTILEDAFRAGGNVIIPSFAVGRTQEVLYDLHDLASAESLPPFDIFVDSPMASAATQIYRDHTECFDEETVALLMKDDGPFMVPRLKFTHDVSESIAINRSKHPAIIISASGMCDAGRIRHHLKHNLWKRNAHVVFVGFQAEGTLGRRLVDGAPRVRIMGEDIAVTAHVHTVGGLSAHADQKILVDWVGRMAKSRPTVFVVHGEEKAGSALAAKLKEVHGLAAHLPVWHESFTF